MITVITGTPGAGKTLYTIEKLLLPQIGKTIKGRDAQGEMVEHDRKVYTNINGLQIEHELIDGGDNQGLRDWHKWAKPGSLIVFDEVQKVWPPRPNGSKIPEDVQSLDTHRHLGVDFILITQNVLNVDRHIHALGGRHLHVRRVANMPLATVYEWDHVSRGLLYSKAITKSAWRYSKKVFKLYKSSELHTKQPRSIPGLVWFILIGLGIFAYLAPGVFQRIGGRISGNVQTTEKKPDAGPPAAAGTPASAQPSQAAVPVKQAPDERVDFTPALSDRPWTAPAYDQLRVVVRMPMVDGAICNEKHGCICFNEAERLEMSSEACSEWLKGAKFNPYRIPVKPLPAPVQAQQVEAKPQTDQSMHYEAPKVQQHADMSAIPKAAKTARLAESGAL
jgi:zona occludens toxin